MLLEILKFKVSIPHLDITSCLESYINHLPVCEFDIMKELDVKVSMWPRDLLKYMGKFKLQDEYYCYFCMPQDQWGRTFFITKHSPIQEIFL